MAKNYSTEIRKSQKEKYLKVFFADDSNAEAVKVVIDKINSVRGCNITISESKSHAGKTLTIYPKPMFDIEEVQSGVITALNSYFNNITIVPEQIVNEASFKGIRAKIIEELDKALNTIYVCVAWFTDKELCAVLKKKKAEGVDVKVIIYKDGVNAKNGVDFGEIEHKELRAERSGIMHQKYCIIDNHVVISGSFNWTNNAEFRNDENIQVTQDWKNANVFTKEFRDKWEG